MSRESKNGFIKISIKNWRHNTHLAPSILSLLTDRKKVIRFQVRISIKFLSSQSVTPSFFIIFLMKNCDNFSNAHNKFSLKNYLLADDEWWNDPPLPPPPISAISTGVLKWFFFYCSIDKFFNAHLTHMHTRSLYDYF